MQCYIFNITLKTYNSEYKYYILSILSNELRQRSDKNVLVIKDRNGIGSNRRLKLAAGRPLSMGLGFITVWGRCHPGIIIT